MRGSDLSEVGICFQAARFVLRLGALPSFFSSTLGRSSNSTTTRTRPPIAATNCRKVESSMSLRCSKREMLSWPILSCLATSVCVRCVASRAWRSVISSRIKASARVFIFVRLSRGSDLRTSFSDFISFASR